MFFSNEQLKAMISGYPVGADFPYNTDDLTMIEEHILRLFHHLKRSSLIDCDAEFDHYGSGYASFVDIFCFKRNDQSVVSKKYIEKDSVTSIEIEGLSLYISRLAPVAVFGRSTRLKYRKEFEDKTEEFYSGFSFLDPLDSSFAKLPNSDWHHEFVEIKKKLSDAGYLVLDKDYLRQTLAFETKISTILSIPSRGDAYKIFDAIFYWSD